MRHLWSRQLSFFNISCSQNLLIFIWETSHHSVIKFVSMKASYFSIEQWYHSKLVKEVIRVQAWRVCKILRWNHGPREVDGKTSIDVSGARISCLYSGKQHLRYLSLSKCQEKTQKWSFSVRLWHRYSHWINTSRFDIVSLQWDYFWNKLLVNVSKGEEKVALSPCKTANRMHPSKFGQDVKDFPK